MVSGLLQVLDRFLQIQAGRTHVREASVHFSSQAFSKKQPHGHGQSLRQQGPVNLLGQYMGMGFFGVLAHKQRLATEHLKEQATKAPDIGSPIDHPPFGLFRAHVGKGADHQGSPTFEQLRIRRGRLIRHLSFSRLIQGLT